MTLKPAWKTGKDQGSGFYRELFGYSVIALLQAPRDTNAAYGGSNRDRVRWWGDEGVTLHQEKDLHFSRIYPYSTTSPD